MDTDSFTVHIKTDFDTSNHELECSSIERPLPKEKK